MADNDLPNSSEEGVFAHEYDGIIEHDNQLPRWWLFTLFGAMAFAVVYWLAYHTSDALPSLRETYAADWAQRETQRKEREAKQPITGEELVALSKDPAAVARGITLFTNTCAACHGQKAEGLVGPNLTDNAWVHGGAPTDIYRVVAEGVIPKAMPAWRDTLGVQATKEVTAFLLTIQNTNVPGKPPEGSPVN
jgi:cytochrome c oxidase cbb3-type subunit III